MGLVVKALVLALLTLPVMAYVTGSMVGARSELPAQREPVVIDDRMHVAPQQTIESQRPRREGPDGRDDRDDEPDAHDDDDADDDGDDSVSVVRPQPREIDDGDDDRDDGPDDDADGDNSGDDGD